MATGARTPEELETLLEDAVLLRDREAVSALFEEDAVIEGDLWESGDAYVAAGYVVQKGNTALVIGGQSINVARRGGDGAWRYAISLLSTEGEQR